MSKKYSVEGNIDFFAELSKSLTKDEEQKQQQQHQEQDTTVVEHCLISSSPLIEKFVELKCHHKFNYIPLYYDLCNHKLKFNMLEGKGSVLRYDEIRCPYCRMKQVFLLPYYEELGLPKVNGVNVLHPVVVPLSVPVTQTNYFKPCQYTDPETGSQCDKICGMSGNYVNADNKIYCYQHRNAVLKKYKAELAAIEHKKKLEEKLKLKEEKLKQKEEAMKLKQQAMKEKQLLKEELKNQVMQAKKQKIKADVDVQGETGVPVVIGDDEQNVVISSTIVGCVQLLKTGPSKGQACGVPIFNDNCCRRHYNLKNKNLKEK